jgi:hypothetical protein
MKCRAGDEPDNNDKHSSSKCPCAAEDHRGTARKNAERIPHDAKEIVFPLVLF